MKAKPLTCDRCGCPFEPSVPGRPGLVREDCKAHGWTERHRYGSRRWYCPQCSSAIESREQARRKRRS